MIISASNLAEECHYQKGVCKTNDGILLWLSTDYNPCRLIKGQSTTCLLTKDRMSCPELQVAVTSITTQRMCGLNVGYSKQGIIFTQDLTADINDFMTTTYPKGQSNILESNSTVKSTQRSLVWIVV